MKKLYPRTYTIHMEPAPGGGLMVTVPEIRARVLIESEQLDDALDAAHLLIDQHLVTEAEETGAVKAS